VADSLLSRRPEGLYCEAGDFFVDPWRPVDRAVITHAHADHARPGHRHYLAAAPAEGVLRARLGADIALTSVAWGEVVEHRGVRISLHPAGHVLGAAQVRLEHRGRVWVVSGDYFLSEHDERNPTCDPFEPVRCDVFITESTFGMPIYRWPAQAVVMHEILQWWQAAAREGQACVLYTYALGKAQRVLLGLKAAGALDGGAGVGPVFAHSAVARLNEAYAEAGIALPPCPTLP